ncbi:unnamed protein product [Parascedosporium putredinis]|uniref:C2H2 type master regulator of conidiophore development brlA n=1 Tax=Parascedosporium putredinis TaxID=1442378 RepID=A0A9P1MAQ1_9PEZI|nr:unnamed protein product [Parascedosporium putredinis]CAI7993170.1 unnamed protein product [Parascedosporium putredinis]
MHARDASGRRVSLLNDEPVYDSYYNSSSLRPHRRTSSQHLSQHYASSRSSSSSPHTPELLRSDSYDSISPSNDPLSPLTPSVAFDYSRQYLYASGQSGYEEYGADVSRKHSSFSESTRSASYEDDIPSTPAVPERSAKRYPCRYRDSHGCEKTFTTSGHASRHSKIHTAEKAVQCTFPGCQKKFTRADNMKQHLETHYKDKSRASSSQRAGKTSSSSSSTRKLGISTRTSSHRPRDHLTLEYGQYGPPTPTHATPLASPATGVWDLRGLNLPLMSQHVTSPNPRNGLDALAMAVACQEGA